MTEPDGSRSAAFHDPTHVRKTAAALFLLSFCLALAGNGSHSLWDRDEARFAEATREMIVDGDWIVPRLNGEIRYDKPILIYWLMSVPMRLWGVNEFSVRFPSAVAGSLTVMLIFLMALRMGAVFSGAVVAALAALACPLLFVISKAATTDATLTLTVTAAMFLYWERRRAGFSWGKHLVFWAILALSALLKGPPGLAIVGLGILCEKTWTLWQDRKSPSREQATAADQIGPPPVLPRSSLLFFALRNLAGLILFLLIALPWAWAAWKQTNGGFFEVAIGKHVIERARTTFEGHGGPIVYYVALLPVLVFPMTALLVNALRWAAGARRNPAPRLLWCWLLPGLVMFSLAQTKLPHYVAPLLPALMLMIGIWWTAMENHRREPKEDGGAGTQPPRALPSRPWWWLGAGFMTLAGGILVGGFAFALLGIARGIGPLSDFFPIPIRLLVTLILFLAFLTPCVFFGAADWARLRPRRAFAYWFAGIVASCLVQVWGILPALEPLRPSKPVALWVRTNAPPSVEILAPVYKEPSLIFYSRKRIRMLGKDDYEEAFAKLADPSTPAALVITKDHWEKWLADYGKEIPSDASVRFQGEYYNFQKGGRLELIVVGNW